MERETPARGARDLPRTLLEEGANSLGCSKKKKKREAPEEKETRGRKRTNPSERIAIVQEIDNEIEVCPSISLPACMHALI